MCTFLPNFALLNVLQKNRILGLALAKMCVFLVMNVISLRQIRAMEVFISSEDMYHWVQLDMSEAEVVRKYLHNSGLCNYPLGVDYNNLSVAGYHLVLVVKFCLVFFFCVYTHTYICIAMLSCVKLHSETVLSTHLPKLKVNQQHLGFEFCHRFFFGVAKNLNPDYV